MITNVFSMMPHCESSDLSSDRCFSSSAIQGRPVRDCEPRPSSLSVMSLGLIDKHVYYFMHVNIPLTVENIGMLYKMNYYICLESILYCFRN